MRRASSRTATLRAHDLLGLPRRDRTRGAVMSHTMNKVLLLGHVGKFGVKLTYLASGKPMLTFTLVLERQVGDKVYASYIPVQVFGRDTEALAEHVEPGDLVNLEGTLGYRQTTGPDAPGKAQRAAQLAVSTF